MKRFISTLCLLVGASVASYAGAITSAAGTNLLGGSAVLQTFDSPSQFPSGAFTSLPQQGGSGVSILTAAGPGPNNTGSKGAISFVTAGNNYVTNFDTSFGGTVGSANSFAGLLTFTFAAPVSEFLFDYGGNASTSNTFTVNGVTTALAVGNGQVGFTSTTSNISSVTFTFTSNSTSGLTQLNGDEVQFDNLRVFGAGVITTTPGTTGGNGGVIPEPSTYAMIGAGLLALAYNRRKK